MEVTSFRGTVLPGHNMQTMAVRRGTKLRRVGAGLPGEIFGSSGVKTDIDWCGGSEVLLDFGPIPSRDTPRRSHML